MSQTIKVIVYEMFLPLVFSAISYALFVVVSIIGGKEFSAATRDVTSLMSSVVVFSITLSTKAILEYRSLMEGVRRNQVAVVKESVLYEGMRIAIEEWPKRINVTSFRSDNPLNHKEDSEIVRYHHTLDYYIKHNSLACLRRIITLQSLEKLEWLGHQIETYRKGRNHQCQNGRASVRILEVEPEFEDPRKVELPAIVQLIGGRVFLADPHETNSRPNSLIVQDQQSFEFWTRYYDGLWHACASGEVLNDSDCNEKSLNRIVFKFIKKYAAWLGQRLHDPDAILQHLSRAMNVFPNTWFEGDRKEPDGNNPYGRNVIFSGDHIEVMIAFWAENAECLPHDHGGQRGVMKVLSGSGAIREYNITSETAQAITLKRSKREQTISASDPRSVVTNSVIHSMRAVERPFVTLHIYTDPIQSMRVFDRSRDVGNGTRVSGKCGAWWPNRPIEHHFPPEVFDVIFED